MSLVADFTLARGDFALEFAATVERGETLALVGPNGAGKSSCLQALGGLIPIDAGSVELDGRQLERGGSRQSLAPDQRRVGFVFQDLLLFPHLSVVENVAYGPRSRGLDRRSARSRATEWLERVGLSEFAERRPGELSGGQAQRVALARALACEPALLLLDEPLSAVDASARAELRRELRQHLDAFDGVRLIVAHDAIDAFALADRVAVLEGGRVVQTGTTPQICGHPRSTYVADLVGLNLFRGTASAGHLSLPGGAELVVASVPDGPTLAVLHPRAVALFRERPQGSPRNVWRSTVAAVEPAIDRLRVRFDAPVPLVAEVTHGAAQELGLGPGAALWIAVKATEISAYSG
ncbi:sulfate/molybdate ABC transporter ATP-binding protein [Engelhardtia mirabilis]|uniref:Sulfate/thiosulfate import ATP-binding protein CysA n=1 Tax=Engelhardtia mirabilis TaxID=2528011 RepID=A0A518BMB1_9BACT|nr:Sulfate/thiosulfate import ATP-binding protein CysA [Planctomycetes bacterium Pla133]QDV02446.1 Sulfate/thiosulfate import ATP-binding protein CysA [Planctomycetes bacterium Pla86]